ncbi:MAG: Energy-coupling factor transporter ATP-binding protein EcfA3 [Accumulibacter sp.]|uniref:energy-coupling factor ABC transporter ATP-binding protein n=1 Tax=Accumulibacter sp. TaxID=2053492 RepID=UPI0011FCE396|nr:ABC transporter ATP-binding protein [Accumulibacter sp.]TLD44215.1 MAG: Energy-coupling factor transporter ATP-binding protein EcfA3 [Accumulibacter sp.]
MAADVLLEVQAVGHVYADDSHGLADCSLAIRRGSRNALLGANGSGKTTLLLHLNGLLQPSSGCIRIDGQPLDYSRGGLTALRRRVGLVFQNPDRQLFSANVFEDVSFGPLNLGLDEASVRARVAQALAAVGMTGQAERPVHHLSFGQKKRVCIAGVLAMQPELLLLDEPMAGLDPGMQDDLLRVLDDLAARGISIVLATHDVDFAYGWADDIHLLAAGRCTASFAAAQLPLQEAALRAAGQPLPAVVTLHQALVAHGALPAGPVPRGMPQLLAKLAMPAAAEDGMNETARASQRSAA